MRPIIQAFSIGLLTASVLLGFIYIQTEKPNNESSETEVSLTDEDAKDYLENRGFAVVNGQEYEDLVRQKQQLESEIDEINESETDSEQESTEKFIFEVESGMTLNDIASELEQLNIIDDAQSFSQFMEEEGYSRGVQLGEFELHNRLTYEQIAEILTR
ncbi:hypothetical protein ACTWQB_08000 [Piscibacillus sp. B03]|uniref:hypothetical protein n=1 Tax=Piscibacillus sp. B03 TaxID=3457430 RepID=UPI003FCD955D